MSKALLMYIVSSSVWYVDFGVLKPSCMCCVSVVISIVVESCVWKHFCEGDRGLCE